MGLTARLAISATALTAAFLVAASWFVQDAHARRNPCYTCTESPVSPAIPPAADSPGHYRLIVRRNPERIPDSHWEVLNLAIKNDLQRRFGDVQILTHGDFVETERLGLIRVDVDRWVRRFYLGTSVSSDFETVPTYIEMRLQVEGRTGVSWEGSHRVNINRLVPSGSAPAFVARERQVRSMVAEMIDQLPSLSHHRPVSGD